MYSTSECLDPCAHMHIRAHVYSARVHTLKYMHAAAVDGFSKVVGERVGGSPVFKCVCVCVI